MQQKLEPKDIATTQMSNNFHQLLDFNLKDIKEPNLGVQYGQALP